MSVFVTNFPDGYGANDLWNTCKLYGHVVNVFIPDRRMNAGKIFGFVRFIKVLDIDRLINNLCTVWVGHNKIHANVARFQREPLHKQSNKVINKGTNNVSHGAKGMINSYAYVVKGNQVQNVGMEECPNMVLDETCLNHEDFSLCLLGKVKEFASLTNLKVVLDKRVIWVEVEGVPCKWWSISTFSRIASRWGTLLNVEELEEEGYHSNKICIRTKLKMVVFDSFKMVYRGMTCWVRAIEIPSWVPNFEEDGEKGYDVNDGSHEDDMYGGVSRNLKDVEGESDKEEVPETNFEEVPDKSIFEGNSIRQNDVHFEDPFCIYEVLNKKRDGKNIDDKHEDSLKYLLGFTPNEEEDVHVEKVDNWSDENSVNDRHEDEVCVRQHVHERVEVSNDTYESTCSGHFKKPEVPRKGGSILELIDDLINVGQTMGYDMTECIKNMEEIIESQGMLWDYLSFVIGNWDGEVVIIGDFNEVCDIHERFGSIFNKHGAEAFNSFIVNAGLVKVPLGLIPFKFFHYWFELDGFDKLVEQTWLEANMNDQNSYSKFMNKLKYLKEKIRIWTGLHKESLNSRKSILKAELTDLHGVTDKGEGSDANGHRRQEVVRLIQEVENVDAMEVAQKAKIKWSIEGDENSKYYLDVLNKKRGRLTIRGVLVDVPGPDGLTFGFYRRYWDIIGNDVVDAVKWIFLHGEIPKGGNSSFITLIPKVPNANMGKDFRPISLSLIGSLYKVIATVLDDIVDEIQSAFVTDRQILDGPFILNEIVHWCKNKKKQYMIFKVDFEKAYDSVRWDFIDDILRRINMKKSNLIGISMDSNKVKHDATKIGASKYRIYSRLFFNGVDVNSKKPSWVRWKSVLAAKDVGGLGVSSLFALILAHV
nr:RNA-directed DNA polymerase, eukaryota, reverse transcriptase zinc-binding domain protein [Tanacetum cinerariifolium]